MSAQSHCFGGGRGCDTVGTPVEWSRVSGSRASRVVSCNASMILSSEISAASTLASSCCGCADVSKRASTIAASARPRSSHCMFHDSRRCACAALRSPKAWTRPLAPSSISLDRMSFAIARQAYIRAGCIRARVFESNKSRRNQWTLRKVNQWLLDVKLDRELRVDAAPGRLDLQNI